MSAEKGGESHFLIVRTLITSIQPRYLMLGH
jgi:hypothetical protein